MADPPLLPSYFFNLFMLVVDGERQRKTGEGRSNDVPLDIVLYYVDDVVRKTFEFLVAEVNGDAHVLDVRERNRIIGGFLGFAIVVLSSLLDSGAHQAQELCPVWRRGVL